MLSKELTLFAHLIVLLASHSVIGIALSTMKTLQDLVCFVMSIYECQQICIDIGEDEMV